MFGILYVGMMEGLCSEGGPGCLTEHVRKDKAEAETCRHALMLDQDGITRDPVLVA